MTMSHQTYLGAAAVKDIALPLLKESLAAFDFSEVRVVEEEDFDGASVLRMTAEVGRAVPASDLITLTADIHDALREQGEERFVYLSTHRPSDDNLPDEAEE